MDKVTKIVTDKFINQLKSREKLPWEEPYVYHNAFGYFSNHTYTGINRWMLPFGEYMTYNAVKKYNSEHGTDYKPIKGIKWYSILFSSFKTKVIDLSKLPSELKGNFAGLEGEYKLGNMYGGSQEYWVKDGKIVERYLVRQFFQVADRNFFKDSNGDCLPTKLNNEVYIAYSDAVATERNALVKLGCGVEENAYEFKYKDGVIHVPDMNVCPSSWFYHFHFFRCLSEAFLDKNKQFGNVLDAKALQCVSLISAGLLCAECGVCTTDGSVRITDEKRQNYNFDSWVSYFEDAQDKIVKITYATDKIFEYLVGGL